MLLYIDPGTGSFIVQAAVAVLAGVAVACRAYWSKLRALFGGRAESDESDAFSAPPEERD